MRCSSPKHTIDISVDNLVGSDAECLDNDAYGSKTRIVQETVSWMVQGDLKAVLSGLSSL